MRGLLQARTVTLALTLTLTLTRCEASSKHYGSFTILIDAVEVTLSGLDLAPTLTSYLTLTPILTLKPQVPPHVRVRELRSEPLQVQVGRMWSKQRKADDEISPSDSINQIPGVGRAPRHAHVMHACHAMSMCHVHDNTPCTRHARAMRTRAHAVRSPRAHCA